MKRNPFFVFLVICFFVFGLSVLLIQSPFFAGTLKTVVLTHLPKDLGLIPEFSSIGIRLFPPALTIRQPSLELADQNSLDLPPGSKIRAERIDLHVEIIQLMLGKINVKEVAVINGDLQLQIKLSRSLKTHPAEIQIPWDLILKARTETIRFQSTQLKIDFVSPDGVETMQVKVPVLKLGRWISKSGPGVNFALEARDFEFTGGKASFLRGLGLGELGQLDALGLELHASSSGITIDQVFANASGFELQGAGTIKGNFKTTRVQELPLELDITSKGTLESLLALANIEHKSHQVAGIYNFKGRVDAQLQSLLKTLSANGELVARDLRWDKQWIDEFKIRGEMLKDSGADQRTVKVHEFFIASEERQRRSSGGMWTPATGGKVSLAAPVQFSLSSQGDVSFAEGITVPLKLERAQLQWLGTPALKATFPLQARISGTIDAKVSRAKEGFLTAAKINLTAENFSFDNQRLNVEKSTNTLLKVPKIEIKGDASISGSDGLRPNLEVSSGAKTKFLLVGSVHPDRGYDLRANGFASLLDVGTIADSPVAGSGPLQVLVQGPSSAVQIHFDGDLAESSYLNLNLGHLKGRITWDDGEDDLRFTKVQMQKNRTPYSVDGKIDFSPKDKSGLIDLDVVSTKEGNIEDFIRIFDFLTRDLWWFPSTVNGPCMAKAKITGDVNMAGLEIKSQVEGHHWQYWGESFRSVSFNLGYDKGKYSITQGKAVKRTGQITADFTYDADQTFDWKIATTDLFMTDLDRVQRLNLPVRGQIQLNSQGHGKPVRQKDQSIRSQTTFQISNSNIGNRLIPSAQVKLSSESGVLSLAGDTQDRSASAELSYDFFLSTQSILKTHLESFDFSPLLILINPALARDDKFLAKISADLKFHFTAGQVEVGSGEASLNEFRLEKSNAKFRLEAPKNIQIDHGTFVAERARLLSKEGQLDWVMGAERGLIDGTLSGVMDLSIVEFFTSAVEDASGQLALSGTMRGPLKDLKTSGRLNLQGGRIKVASLESPFENFSTVMVLKQNIVTVQSMDADLAGGRFTGSGQVGLFLTRVPTLSLKGILLDTKLKIYPFQQVKVRGSLGVTGYELPYLVDGEIIVDSGMVREKMFNKRNSEGLRSAQYLPNATNSTGISEDRSGLFKLNIHAVAEDSVWVKNDLFDAEFKGNLTVVNTLEIPRILGTVGLVQGKMNFKDRSFTLQTLNVEFDSPIQLNPQLSLTSTTDVNNIRIQLAAFGRLNSLKAELSSNPPMPERELVTLLALGVTSQDTKKLSASDRATFEQGEAASLILNSLDFNREVQSKTGFEIQLDESINSQTGTSAFKAQTGSESLTSPKIVIKRKIGERLSLSFGNTLGVGANSRREGAAEIHINRGFSVMGVFDTYETPGATPDKSKTNQSYGADLKWQKRFK